MQLSEIDTLVTLLEFRDRATPDRIAFTFGEQAVTFHQLHIRANQYAADLAQRGVQRGDRVVLVLPNGADFFHAFYSVLYLGGIAVPVSPESSADRVRSIAAACEATAVVVIDHSIDEQLARDSTFTIIHARESGNLPKSIVQVTPRPDDVAYIQYTSGSTGNPKGVQLSHANLMTNIRQLIAGMQITSSDIFVSWLPIYHDMGLILMTLVPFYLAAELHLLPTNLNNVQSWLEKIQATRATFIAAPDFAYRFCLHRVRDRSGFDLSSLRVALNAAEPVRGQTIHDFEAAFNLKHVMRPGYGLAEATVGVSMWPPGSEVKVDERGVVSVGPPFPQIKIQIIRDGKPIGPHAIGEIAIDSPANTRGYYRNPIETAALFWHDTYILSGDLGYLDEEGNLFVVGRRKNIIKQAGETIYPAEVEEAVEAIDGIRLAAAIGIDRGDWAGEQIVVLAEFRLPSNSATDRYEDLVINIVNAIKDRIGLRPGRVYLVKPHTIPRTPNGKLQHAQLKEDYLSGRLKAAHRLIYPDAD